MERNLEGQHAIVTGGSRGIGAAVAVALAQRGARITLMARAREDLEVHVAALEQLGARAIALECDVADDSSVERAFEKAGPAQILVNNAGTAKSAKFTATSRAIWDEMIGVNLTGTYLCTAEALPAMLAEGTGRVINIASTAGLRGYKTMTAYCAAKHGVIGFTRALALETAKHGVTVNAVCPGYTDTDLTDHAIENIVSALGKTPEQARAMLVGVNPRGVMTTPDEVAATVAWLCAPESRAITGVAIPVAGGEVG
ncbi:MAG: SDR family NAD(P)-dependent oxidoreductase [Gemmatimonadota bacterium]